MTDVIWMIKCLEFTSLITGSIAVLTLFFASLDFPDPSWKEETKPEIRHKSRQSFLKWIGFPCFLVSVICAALVIILRP